MQGTFLQGNLHGTFWWLPQIPCAWHGILCITAIPWRLRVSEWVSKQLSETRPRTEPCGRSLPSSFAPMHTSASLLQHMIIYLVVPSSCHLLPLYSNQGCNFIKWNAQLGVMVRACNPSYSGSEGRRNLSLRPAGAKIKVIGPKRWGRGLGE
jgi:hypothetical protein